MNPRPADAQGPVTATAEDLLLGARARHRLTIPADVLHPTPDGAAAADGEDLQVVIRPLTVEALVLIARAAQDNPSLVPVLSLHQALVEPQLSVDEVRAMHVGLVHFLMEAVNRASGLAATGEVLDAAMDEPAVRANLMLARHFGWTPEQVAQLTPGQVAVYLAGIERLAARDQEDGP